MGSEAGEEELPMGRRVLRSDVAKQRAKEAGEAKVLRSGSVRNTGPVKPRPKKLLVVRDHESSKADVGVSEEDTEAESKSTVSSDTTEKGESDKALVKRLAEEENVSGPVTGGCDSVEALERVTDDCNGAEALDESERSNEKEKTTDETVQAEANSQTGEEIKSVGRKRKGAASVRAENRRFTRSSSAKLTEETSPSGKEVALLNVDVQKKPTERGSAEAFQNGNSVDSGGQAGIDIDEIVESNIGEKNSTEGNIESVNREAMRPDISEKRDEADSGKLRKDSLDSAGLKRKRGRPASDACTKSKKAKTGSSSCKESKDGEIEEDKKMILRPKNNCRLGPEKASLSKRHKNGLNGMISKPKFKNGVKWSRHLGQMTLKQLKRSVGTPVGFSKNSNGSPEKQVKRGRGRPRKEKNCESENGRPPKKKNCASENSHSLHSVSPADLSKNSNNSSEKQVKRGRGRPRKEKKFEFPNSHSHVKTSTVKQKVFCETGIQAHSASPVGLSKYSDSYPEKQVKRGRGRPPKEKNMEHIAVGKLLKNKVFRETEIRAHSATPSSKERQSKNAFLGKGPVSLEGGSIAAADLTKKEKDEELRKARQKLRAQINDMLFSAGWKLELRPRHGKRYVDKVYVEPNGHTHWSITKAYYTFLKHASPEGDDKGRNLTGASKTKSLKLKYPSFTPIPEESLSILKHPISKRRTRSELEGAGMNLADGSTGKKRHKKHRKHASSLVRSGAQKVNLKKVSRGKTHIGKYRRKRKGCALLVRSFTHDTDDGTEVYIPYTWKRTTLSWMIDLGVMCENAAVNYMNGRHTKTLLNGHITRDGIHCSCCSKTVTVADFEIHSGSKQCKPYKNIVVEESGTSLLDCLINAWKKQDESERKGFYSINTHGDDQNDDTCGICGDGGDLICCDGCPSTFHQSCLGTEMLPSGNWYCMNCSCKYCMLNRDGIDFPLLSCSQCEERYHQSCIPEEDAAEVSSSPSGSSFCGRTCKKLLENLQQLLGVKNHMEAGFSWTILQRFDEDLPESICTLDQRANCNSKIAVALAVMDECFLPILDQRSGINLIHNVVYNCGSNFSRLNYSGFYTFILEKNDEIICVASLRFHGTRVAEMPFIGTRNMYRRQGMCRRLLNEIEAVLRTLNVEKLIIPAISELKDTWMNVFGFKLLEVTDKEETKSINLVVFPGTGLLLKSLLEKDSVENCKAIDEDDFEPKNMPCCFPEGTKRLSSPPDVDLEPRASDNVIDQHKHGVEQLECGLNVSSSCVESSSKMLSSDAQVEVKTNRSISPPDVDLETHASDDVTDQRKHGVEQLVCDRNVSGSCVDSKMPSSDAQVEFKSLALKSSEVAAEKNLSVSACSVS